jgi:flagellar hook-basal body complex protein FliE
VSEINFNPSVPGIGQIGKPEAAPAGGVGAGQKFGEVLKNSLAEASRLQADADKAVESLGTAKPATVAEIMTAMDKAKLAFDMLLQIRNKLLDAYNDVRQMRI